MNKKLLIICILLFAIFFISERARAGTKTVKSTSSDTVYYVDDYGTRHAFPNLVTYQSWFGRDFSQVEIISDEVLASIRLGNNVVVRSGKYLLKVPSSPKVYALEPGGVLRHITTSSLASQIFGSAWQLKLKDLPEVFFNNYTVGEPISLARQIPDGVVYQVTGVNSYYWKNRGVMEPFTDWSAAVANGFDKFDVVISDLPFFTKLKPVTGRNDRIYNLSLTANQPTATCTSDSLHAALVFVTQTGLDSSELHIIKTLADNLATSWSIATDGLSQLEVDSDVVVFEDRDGFLLRQTSGKVSLNLEELGLEFYELKPDAYDFLIVFNDFLPANEVKEQASYTLVRNDFSGTNRIRLQRENFYGSLGRLKGIVNMNMIDQYSVSSQAGLVSLLDLVQHELLHHWGASVSFLNEAGERAWDLVTDDKYHWSKWLRSVSPLGGWGWQDIGIGVFESGLLERGGTQVLSFSELDLYLMGLVPARYVTPVEYIVPDNPASVSDQVRGELRQVASEQIIAVQGPIACNLD